MALRILQFGLYFIGLAAILIGSSIALIGIERTGQFFVWVLSWIGDSGPLSDLGQPNDDSELRFYSVFFIAYGALLFQAARKPIKYARRIPLLLALFFAGGVVRAISYIQIGPPHDLFILLMAIELIMPIVLYICWRAAKLT